MRGKVKCTVSNVNEMIYYIHVMADVSIYTNKMHIVYRKYINYQKFWKLLRAC